jgi:serine/threonine protein kinase
MGRVEVALQRSDVGFERVVALKRLLPKGPRDARHVQMFLREARIATLLTHPNVVHAFSFGEAEGEFFLAMQYVEGETLSRVLAAARAKGGSLEPVLVAWVLAEACEGLHAAHELRDAEGKLLRVVHRDVSPHNVMVSYDGNVKVVDFGIARFDSGGHATRTGEVKGKLAYMSPEQALGEELDRRSDVFSMGAVLFECLTGQRMWGEGTDLELMRKIALERPPRIDAIFARAPAALVDLQAQMVARDREDRPATARDVATKLRAFAVAAGGPSSRRVVPTTMTALFADDARTRRDRLAAALQEASPNAVVLARDDELAMSGSPAGEASSRSRRWLVPAVIASCAMGLGAMAFVPRRPPPAVPPRAAEPVAPTSQAPADPTPAASASAPEIATARPALEATVVKASPSRNVTYPAKPVLVAKPAPSGKLPHVDPSPF